MHCEPRYASHKSVLFNHHLSFFTETLVLNFRRLTNYRVADLLDYTADEMVGRNMYTLCHGQDSMQLRKCHLDRKHDWLQSVIKQELNLMNSS